MPDSPLSPKRSRIDTTERDVVVGMIVSDQFLSRLRPHWEPSWHLSELCRLAAGWCAEHWDKYQRAPREEIQTRWEDWSALPEAREANVDGMEHMLALASEQYENRGEINVDYLIDRAELWIHQREMKQRIQDAEGDLDVGDVERAAESIEGIVLTRLGGRRSWLDPSDKETVKTAWEKTYTPLFEMPGAFGQLFGPQMYREGLVGIMAPDKRGKTSLLFEFAYWAARCRQNVAYFAIGDMSDNQLLMKWHSRLTGLPDDQRYAGMQKIPRLEFDGEESEITWEEQNIHLLNWKKGLKASQRFDERYGKGHIRFQSWPNFTCSNATLEGELDVWEAEGWVPDVVITDYADNLETDSKDEFRHKENAKWQGQRKISQERRCLAITATQTDARVYETDKDIGLGNFSNDKRKFAHCTAFYAINQTKSEQQQGVLRFDELPVTRRGKPRGQVVVLTDLARGKLLVTPRASWWHRPVTKKEEE